MERAYNVDSQLGFTQDIEGALMEQSESGFTWDYLPLQIWETILSWLPISSLLRMKSVCKPWKFLIQSESFLSAYKSVSPQDLYFLLFADFVHRNVVAAYNPTEDKWVLISLSHISSSCPIACCRLRRALISDGALVLAEDRKGAIVVSNLFTKTRRILPPMIPFIWPYVVALIVLDCSYKIVAVSTSDKVYTQVYDSVTERWEVKAQFDGRFALLGNAAYLDGFLFCLGHFPDKLLAFDVENGIWSTVNVRIPCAVCSHVLIHCGVLILVGGFEEDGIMNKIGIWEFIKSENRWREICFMPDHIFARFSHGHLNHFIAVDRCGKICFCKSLPSILVMYDLTENRWWWLPPCPLGLNKVSWFGLAVEPRIDVLV